MLLSSFYDVRVEESSFNWNWHQSLLYLFKYWYIVGAFRTGKLGAKKSHCCRRTGAFAELPTESEKKRSKIIHTIEGVWISMCPSFGWIQNICSSPLVFVIPANSLLRTIAVYPSALDLPFSFSSLYYLLKACSLVSSKAIFLPKLVNRICTV